MIAIFLLFLQNTKLLIFLKRTICIFLSAILGVVLLSGQDLALHRVVIDAGHGGKDPGCVSPDKKTYEKTLTLDIATKLADMIIRSYPDVEVVLSRSSDKYVSLDARASVANRCDANLFISIHINASPNKQPNGYSIHVLGQSSNKDKDLFAYNLNVCQRENAVVRLEDDYSTKYQDFDPSDPESFIFMTLMQNAYLEQSLNFAQIASDKLSSGPIPNGRGVWQDPFYVLWKTSMPAVLVELGFISNSQDLATLKSESNRELLAKCLFDAFAEYKNQYDSSVAIDKDQIPAEEAPEEKKMYGIQIFAGTNKMKDGDPAFMGYIPKRFLTFNFCRYVISVTENISEAKKNLENVKRMYPDAFLVCFMPDSTVPERVF